MVACGVKGDTPTAKRAIQAFVLLASLSEEKNVLGNERLTNPHNAADSKWGRAGQRLIRRVQGLKALFYTCEVSTRCKLLCSSGANAGIGGSVASSWFSTRRPADLVLRARVVYGAFWFAHRLGYSRASVHALCLLTACVPVRRDSVNSTPCLCACT